MGSPVYLQVRVFDAFRIDRIFGEERKFLETGCEHLVERELRLFAEFEQLGSALFHGFRCENIDFSVILSYSRRVILRLPTPMVTSSTASGEAVAASTLVSRSVM